MKFHLYIALALSMTLGGCSLQPVQQTTEQTEQQNNVDVPTEKSGPTLDLSNQNLEQIPAYIFDLTDLKELNISHNKLTGAIQAEIRQLKNLKTLNASNNNMTGVPAEIGQLSNLEVLNLSNNDLTGLPYELGNLQNLQVLDISGNDYSETDLNIITEKLPEAVRIVK